ncbi:MAG TPA: PD-(D/E)XK nuclease family protein [Terracidiphilus sp.]
MRTIPGADVDAWLRAGGTVFAASERAARALGAAYHRARRGEGLSAWAGPQILSWHGFARAEWERRGGGAQPVLNPVQEQSLWLRVIVESGQTAGWLETARRRLADLAMEAHALLCAYEPDLLRPQARRNWQQDAGAFSEWLTGFDDLCERAGVLSASRVPLALLRLLEEDFAPRRPVVLAGFDRLLPIHQRVLQAWGDWQSIEPGTPAVEVHSYAAANDHLELAACARWCRRQLEVNPQARLLVIVPDANQRRGEMERAFLKHTAGGHVRQFEFSLGVPLAQVGLARAALLLLRWLDGALEEHELDWLLGSGYSAGPEETAALQAYMRALRRRGLQRVRWTLDGFRQQPAALPAATAAWFQRMAAARHRLREASGRRQSPLDWAGLAAQLLEATGWPAVSQLTSSEFQAATRWQQALDSCGSLGFDGGRTTWDEFFSELDRISNQMLFAEESKDAPILIAGPAESAGLIADGAWFMGADEDSWPASGSTHPLLPLDVQRNAAMPHASPGLDWGLAESITIRLLRSARHVCFSYARQKDEVEARPSRLVVQHSGAPEPMPDALAPEPPGTPLAAAFQDIVAIPLPSVPARKATAQLSLFDDTGTRREIIQAHEVPGGSMILSAQSQCAFKAFATARLGAQQWKPAEAGLTALQRGNLLHEVLHSVWSDTPDGIRSWTQLQNVGAELRPWVEGHVRRVLEQQITPGAREQMPSRYLELEEQRLTRVVVEWLEYERTRVPFDVAATEIATDSMIAGLTLKLRLDRVDRLNDGSLLVIDYKTGNVSPRSWELPRPEDVQLPLYAGFAVPAREEVGGLVFAKIRPGERRFDGRIANAQSTIDAGLNGTSGLVKYPLTPAQLTEWREKIEQLARDFIAGRADVDPREYPETCESCGLYTICRIREREDHLDAEEDALGVEAADE